jgi:hypothetical protein
MKNESMNPELMELYQRVLDTDAGDPEYSNLIQKFSDVVKMEIMLAQLSSEMDKAAGNDSQLKRLLNNGPLVGAVGSLSLGLVIVMAELFGSAIINSKALNFAKFK